MFLACSGVFATEEFFASEDLCAYYQGVEENLQFGTNNFSKLIVHLTYDCMLFMS